ncbi:MAG: HepT-like ribonuclease domain-containing protein [bacterium]
MNSDIERLEEILRRIEKAQRFTATGEVDFFRNDLIQEATIRQLEIIGEAANALNPEVRGLAPDIPWKAMIDARHKMIHFYFKIDLFVVWNAVEEFLPPLQAQIEGLLIKLRAPSN